MAESAGWAWLRGAGGLGLLVRLGSLGWAGLCLSCMGPVCWAWLVRTKLGLWAVSGGAGLSDGCPVGVRAEAGPECQ